MELPNWEPKFYADDVIRVPVLRNSFSYSICVDGLLCDGVLELDLHCCIDLILLWRLEMSKRLRSLASLLWDDGDPHLLAEEWRKRNVSGQTCLMDAASEVPDAATEKHVPCIKAISQARLVEKPWLRRLRRKDAWFWLEELPNDIKELDRFKLEVVPDLKRTTFADGAIIFDLPDSSLASSILKHAESTIRSFSSKSPALFKIGATSNPVVRWQHSRYGYVLDKHVHWDSMTILHVHTDPALICLLEAAIIRIFYDTPGCRNIRLGGEGINHVSEGPFFCYVVRKAVGTPEEQVIW